MTESKETSNNKRKGNPEVLKDLNRIAHQVRASGTTGDQKQIMQTAAAVRRLQTHGSGDGGEAEQPAKPTKPAKSANSSKSSRKK